MNLPEVKLPKINDEFIKEFASEEYINGDALYRSGNPVMVIRCGCKIYSYFGKYFL